MQIVQNWQGTDSLACDKLGTCPKGGHSASYSELHCALLNMHDEGDEFMFIQWNSKMKSMNPCYTLFHTNQNFTIFRRFGSFQLPSSKKANETSEKREILASVKQSVTQIPYLATQPLQEVINRYLASWKSSALDSVTCMHGWCVWTIGSLICAVYTEQHM